MTCQLGFRYLWIDSLCIIQDSKKDWEIESALVQIVYENAVMNKSADAAPHYTAGLCSTEKLAWHLAGPAISTDSLGGSHVHSRQNYRPIFYTRAWAFQEQLLLLGILTFLEYEIAWECDKCCQCECSTSPRKPARPFCDQITKSKQKSPEDF